MHSPSATSPAAHRHAILGGGRAARHHFHYFRSQQMNVVWAPNARDAELCRTQIAGATVVWICVSDRAIDEVITRTWRETETAPILLHVSGAHISERARAMHPLMTFGPELYDLNAYPPIAFVGDEHTPELSRLAPELDNPFYRVPASERARYHALCAMAGGFSTLLWQRLFRDFEARWNIPASAAHPFLQRMTAQLMQNPESALTGPLARGDWPTIEKHLDVLGDDPLHAVYQAFVQAYIPGENL